MSREKNDDLFDSSKMTFGEHLEELRSSLLKAAYGLVIGIGFGFYFANDVVQMVQHPLQEALGRYYVDKEKENLREELNLHSDLEGYELFEAISTLEEYRLIPVEEQVDPFVLIENLRAQYPGQFDAIDIDRCSIRLDEILDDRNVVKMLDHWESASSEEGDSVGKRVWRVLTTEQRATVRRLADQDSLSKENRTALAEILNILVNDSKLSEGIYDTKKQELFVKPANSDAKIVMESLARNLTESGIDEQVRELNRLLLWDAYPQAIGRPAVHLVGLPVWREAETSVKALSAHEVFMIWLKAAIITGIVISSPWLFWHGWGFVAAGLYPAERKHVYIYLPLSLILFFSGVALAYNFVFEFVLDFLFSFNKAVQIDPDPRISEWIGFVLILPLGFGISFQLPLVMLFMERIGLVSISLYLSKWRVAILIIAVISMLLTPADPISMLLMAIPLTILYFFGIALCRWMPRRRSPIDEAYEP